MGFVKKLVESKKLKTGESMVGYLLAKRINSMDKDGETVSWCSLTLKTAAGPVKTNVGADYDAILVIGCNTRISKETVKVDGEDKVKTVVEQDDADKITV